MKLKKIKVRNYKSIRELEIPFSEDNKGFFGFLGINEAGKSNLLRAISIKDNLNDFNYDNSIRKEVDGETIEILYEFDWIFSKEELKEMIINGREQIDLPEGFIEEIEINKIVIKSFIEKGKSPLNKVQFGISNKKIVGWSRDPKNLIKLEENVEFDLGIFLNEQLTERILKEIPRIIFWKSEDKYLMNNPINLAQFKGSPEKISIPLKNCFKISGYDNIQETLDKFSSDPNFKGEVIETLDKEVTKFINEKWDNHKVKLSFTENGGSLFFQVKREDGKREGLNSRSEGFRQFISFLLSSSAEVKSDELKDSIIIIDEPESHLYPTSQEDLLKELIEISKKNFVLFATHSSYLIDRENFSNYWRVIKENEETKIIQFEDKATTFAEINYVVFEIPTTDYHNELYGWCEENKKEELDNFDKKESYIWKDKKGKKGNTTKISLTEYIRHQIHHPDNLYNKRFTRSQLVASIKKMRELKYGKTE